MKIICVGLNYGNHAAEMNLDVPQEPMFFLKPDSAILRAGNPFFIPDWAKEFQYEAEVVVKICRLGKYINQKFANRYYAEVSLGIDFTAIDLWQKLTSEGKPWECAKAFDDSAAIGEFIPLDQLGGDIQNLDFRLEINGQVCQQANTSSMIRSVDEIIENASRFFTLKIGDLIYTGTPSGVGKIKIGDHLQGYLQDRKVFDFYIR